jgi:hypothetical protein
METIDKVHTDLDTPYLCDGMCHWNFSVSPGSGSSDRIIDPNQALLYANSSTWYQSSAIPSQYNSFIGAGTEGAWILPQNSTGTSLYLGFSAERMVQSVKDKLCSWNPQDPRGSADVSAKWLKVQLVDVRGPEGGKFSMWQTSGFSAPDVYFSTYEGGITEEDVFHYTVGAHTHMNWGFTQPGFYDIDFQISTYYQCDPALIGDLTGDCLVDLNDFALLGRWWLARCNESDDCISADVIPDTWIDPDDLSVVIDQWLLCGSPFDSECP